MVLYTFVIIAWVIWFRSGILPFTEIKKHVFISSTVLRVDQSHSSETVYLFQLILADWEGFKKRVFWNVSAFSWNKSTSLNRLIISNIFLTLLSFVYNIALKIVLVSFFSRNIFQCSLLTCLIARKYWFLNCRYCCLNLKSLTSSLWFCIINFWRSFNSEIHHDFNRASDHSISILAFAAFMMSSVSVIKADSRLSFVRFCS